MRRIIKYCLFLPVILALSCCQGAFGVDVDAEGPTRFTATIEGGGATKTVLAAPDAIGVRAVLWSAGDNVVVGSAEYTLSDGAGTTSGTLSGSGAVPEGGVYKAYYPVEFWNSGSLELRGTLSFAEHVPDRIAHLPMYAQSVSTSLTFRNLCSVLRIRVTGPCRVTKIIVGSLTAYLSGEVTVSGSDPEWRAAIKPGGANLSNEVCLDYGTGVSIATTTEFFLPLPPGTYGRGDLTIAVWDGGAAPLKVYRNDKAPSSGAVLERSKIYQVPSALELGFEEVAWDGRLSATWQEGVNWQ